MAAALNPLAPHDLPSFITAPGETDSLMVLMAIGVPLTILLLGVTFFWLHTLPERLGHKKLQFEVVAVLGLIALFTHMHVFWVIGLLLALIDLPDLLSPLRQIGAAAERIAANLPPATQQPEPAPVPAEVQPAPVLAKTEADSNSSTTAPARGK